MLLPRLVQYWDTIAMDMVDRSSAKVVVVMGASARASYERHRRRRENCRFEALEIPLGTGYLRQTWGYLEYNSGGAIERLVIFTDHVENFIRGRSYGWNLSDKQRAHVVQERMLDLAILAVYGRISLPGLFVSSSNYFVTVQHGLFLPREFFEPFQRKALEAAVKSVYFINERLLRWVRKNAVFMKFTPADAKTLVNDTCLTFREWVQYLEQQSALGDVNAVSLQLVAQRYAKSGLLVCANCGKSYETQKSGCCTLRLVSDGPLVCGACWKGGEKTCDKCGKTRAGEFRSWEGHEGKEICPDCQVITFECSVCRRDFKQKRIRRSPKNTGKSLCSQCYRDTVKSTLVCGRCKVKKHETWTRVPELGVKVCGMCYGQIYRKRTKK
jgi:hypothetical protein